MTKRTHMLSDLWNHYSEALLNDRLDEAEHIWALIEAFERLDERQTVTFLRWLGVPVSVEP